MIIAVPKEIKNNENRVSLTPAGVHQLKLDGHDVVVEKNAGAGSGFADEEYIREGAKILATAKEVYDAGDIIVKVKEPLKEEYDLMKTGQAMFVITSYSIHYTKLYEDANYYYSYSAAKTLRLAQSLYEKHKLITYPRTDSRFLSHDMAGSLKTRLSKLNIEPWSEFAETALQLEGVPKRVIWDARVTDHHASYNFV